MVTRHEFLKMLHRTLRPRGYLEIGVFTGESLRLVNIGTPAIGIDPSIHLVGHFPGTTRVYQMTSDEFFHQSEPEWQQDWFPFLDLAFIDGMHLFEYALRDFENIERYANQRTVVVFDDVLPRNQHEAARYQCPGDWTGDVWKVPRMLELFRPYLQMHLVDTAPTGTAVVYGFDSERTLKNISEQVTGLGLEAWETVPEEILNRETAISPETALDQIIDFLEDR